MRMRFGLALATMVVVGAGACASGAGAPPGPRPGDEVIGDDLPRGEEPRENEYTEQANEHFRAAGQAEADSAFDRAREEYHRALEAAQTAIQIDSTNPLPYYQAGLAYLGIGEFAAADSVWDRAEELHPPYGPQLEPLRQQQWVNAFNEGVEAIQAGDEAEAVRKWEQADAIWKGRPEAMLNLGAIYANTGRPEEAIDAFEQAIETINAPRVEDVDSATLENWRVNERIARRNLAALYTQLERWDEAARAWEEVLARDPDDPAALAALANVMVAADRPDSARAIYERLLEAEDLDAEHSFQAGIGFYQMDAFDEAARAFENTLRIQPYNRNALQNLGQALLQRIVAARAPEDPADSLSQAELRTRIERMDEVADRLMEIDPRNAIGYELKAQAQVRLGDSDAAEEVLERGDNLPFTVTNSVLTPSPNGGGSFRAQVTNRTLPEGTEIRLRVTLYHEGRALGSDQVTLRAPEQEGSVPIEISILGDDPATGFSYEVLAP